MNIEETKTYTILQNKRVFSHLEACEICLEQTELESSAKIDAIVLLSYSE